MKRTIVFFQRKPLPFHKSLEFIFDDVRSKLNGDFIAVKYIFSRFSTGLLNRLQILAEARKNKGDVNHVTGDIHFAVLALPKRNTVLTILDCGALTEFSGIKRYLLKQIWFSLPARHARFVTVISQATKDDLVNYTRVDPAKIIVIPVAISAAFSRSDKPFNKQRPVLLQIGTVKNKNIPRLAQAIRDIDCELNIIGRVDDELRNVLNDHQIRWSHKTDLTMDQVIEQYVACDMLTLVSEYEGFGMPIIEAQTVGRPVVTSNVYSMPEVAGRGASFVDPFDVNSIRNGILKVINDDLFRDSIVTEGFENVKRYDSRAIASQYQSLYEQILRDRN
jgi:glycosyltransferase involved in cell wall biosynthesis